MPGVDPPEPTRFGEVPWLQPYPDSLLEDAIALLPGPEARYEQSESISLAFVTALQLLPPRQLAVLVLRDVLGFHANEVAGMLDSTVESVNSALKRARAGLKQRLPVGRDLKSPPPARSPSESSIVASFVAAYESADLESLVALLTDDVFISMPPLPFEYEGREAATRFFASIFGSGRRFDLVPTRANGQPALGAYVCGADGIRHGVGLFVVTLIGDAICAMTRFENTVLPWFGLPEITPEPITRNDESVAVRSMRSSRAASRGVTRRINQQSFATPDAVQARMMANAITASTKMARALARSSS